MGGKVPPMALDRRTDSAQLRAMNRPDVFHAHIYFDPTELEQAQALAERVRVRFGVKVGRFHQRPVGPHPRGSCQLTVPGEVFGDFTTWAAVNRGALTIFGHAETGNDLIDHTSHVVWFGPSEELNLSQFM